MIQAILEVAVAAVVALVAEALLTQKEGAMYAVGAEVQLAVGVGAEGFCPLVVRLIPGYWHMICELLINFLAAIHPEAKWHAAQDLVPSLSLLRHVQGQKLTLLQGNLLSQGSPA